MGKLGKETKNLLLAITVICLISFLLAAGLSFLLAKDFQHEMLLHDYGVSGYQLNHEDKLQISAFTAHPNESDIERGKEALASIGYSEATSMQLLPTVREYRNQTMLYLFLLLLFLFGMVYLVLLFYLRRQHRAIDDAGSKIREFLDGNSMSRIECSQTGDWYSLFHDVNEMATILSAHAESQKQTKEFLQDIISDVSHQIKTPLSALKMYHEIISSHKGEAETVANFSEKSQREIKRMENVIYTLLKLARLDAGIIQMEKAEENVSALMQDVLERFETWAEQDHKQTVEEENLFYKINYRLGRLYEVMQENKNSIAKERADLQELISDISHQVKTPIANLKMINNTLLENEVPPQKQKEFLTAQASQLDKLDFLMQAMIKTSRLETGVISLEQRQQPIYDTLAAALGGILLNAEKKKIDVQVECPEHLDARHDRKWTSEALFNILDNAVKYTPAGGQIRVSVEGWEMYVKIDIADTGIGISEQHQGTIFKRFYREDVVHDVDGIGIGLYLAREIVTLQGGYIRVASEVGKGSTFSVFLLRK